MAIKTKAKKTSSSEYKFLMCWRKPPPPKDLSRLKPFCIWEFLRIEALLRSPKVKRLYGSRSTDSNDELRISYEVPWGWDVLNGAHHELLDPTRQHISSKTGQFPAYELWHDCVIDIGKAVESFPDSDGMKDLMAASMRRALPQGVCLLINPVYSNNEITEKVISLVERYRATLSDDVRKAWHSWRYTKQIDLAAWMDYLRCYDLYVAGATYGKIGPEVYGGQWKQDAAAVARMRNRAKQGVKQVANLVDWAEAIPRKPWPPPSSALAKSRSISR